MCSAATTRRKLTAVQAARLASEELQHLLEPRRRHPVNFAAGLLLLLVLSAGLAILDLMELSAAGGLRSVLPALAATAVWLTGAWLGAVAARQRRWTLVAALAGAGVLLGLCWWPCMVWARIRPGRRLAGAPSSAYSPAPSSNGTVGYQKCLNASSLPSYPQKIAVGSRSISCRRSSMCGDGGSCS